MAAIAKTLEMPLEDYIAQVIHFAMNPNAQPEVVILSEAELKGHGLPPPPSAAEARLLLDRGGFAGQGGTLANEFSAHKAEPDHWGRPMLARKVLKRQDEKLKEELMKQLRVKRDGR